MIALAAETAGSDSAGRLAASVLSDVLNTRSIVYREIKYTLGVGGRLCRQAARQALRDLTGAHGSQAVLPAFPSSPRSLLRCGLGILRRLLCAAGGWENASLDAGFPPSSAVRDHVLMDGPRGGPNRPSTKAGDRAWRDICGVNAPRGAAGRVLGCCLWHACCRFAFSDHDAPCVSERG